MVLLVIQALVLAVAAVAGAPPPRLAIGSFGLQPETRDAQLADLVAAHLSAKAEFSLVERRELDALLREAKLGLAGLASSKDAVRIGALLRADLFLLGNTVPINGTNRLIARLVDARTGVMRSVRVFPDNPKLDRLATDVAAFASAEKSSGLPGNRRDFLAIGVIQNLGVNNRFTNFPAQMRGSLAALLSSNVTVLEREVVSFLAQEYRLDAGQITAREEPPAGPMQFGFWIVDAFYQSLEIADPEVQLKLRVEQVRGGELTAQLQGKPDEKFFVRMSGSIQQAIGQLRKYAAAPSRPDEIAALEARARELVDIRRAGSGIYPPSIWLRTALNPEKAISALDEATRIFESMLLIDPRNNSAKMRLAACLIYDESRVSRHYQPQREARNARACGYLQEVIDSADPEHSDEARLTLALLRNNLEAVDELRRLAATADTAARKTRFRYHRSQLLRQLEYNLPVESILPALRAQLIDELTDLRASTNEWVSVSLDEVLFAFRFDPERRESIINKLLPELFELFPELKPHLLLTASAEQTTTNAPVTAQFLASLKECEARPESVWRSSNYFRNLASTVEDETDVRKYGGVTRYQRTFDNKQYPTVIAAALARQKAAEKGLAPPLTAIGKLRLAESYMALKQWQEALNILDALPEATPQAKNDCRIQLGMQLEDESIPESRWRSETDRKKVELAYQCIERRQFPTAVAILESIGGRTVAMTGSGPWGHAFTPVLPELVAAQYRAQAGKPAVRDARRFTLGDVPYVHFEKAHPFAFDVEGEDVWLATYDELKRFRGPGPFAVSQPAESIPLRRTTRWGITCIAVSRDFVWAGTWDDGLFELNRRTRTVTHLTMKEGLPLNGVSGLKLQPAKQLLWITYHNDANGAVGTLDLTKHRFSTLTPNLSAAAGKNSLPYWDQAILDVANQPPTLPVSAMTEADPGDMWFAVQEKGLQRFRTTNASWETPWRASRFHSHYAAMTAIPSQGLLLVANRQTATMDSEKTPVGGLDIHNYRENKHTMLRLEHGLPANDASAVAADGHVAWIGGHGFVAVVDLRTRKVTRVAYVSASRIANIKLSPNFAWIHIVCTEYGDRDYAGNARTGVYRVRRGDIEPGLQTSQVAP